MTDLDPIEQARMEQHIALLTEAQFTDLVLRTRPPAIGGPDAEMRALVANLLGRNEETAPVEPPQPQGSTVPRGEGRHPGAPQITAEQRAVDWLRRLTDPTYANEPELP